MFPISRLKNLLILLLALALPLQGYAAAAMVFCASSETAETSASSTPHHHADQQVQLSDHSATHAKHDAASHGKTSSSCSSCAACCIGMMPVSTTVAAKLPALSAHYTRLRLSGFVGYTPENPERPPSSLV
ncbi:hypothetical protein [Paraherbaspirillum soli]|uniref:DUF2946 domain-containing protein n=1 Tax=Paraherbaspirillum soli TaxID=631222 RepID=A0ABW0MAA0_9BURK